MTVTPKALVKAMTERDGHHCAWCGVDDDTLVPHHRANRGMGGRNSLNRLSNLIWLCSRDNGAIESDPLLAEKARKFGIKISTHDEPSHTPIQHAAHGYVLLNDDGTLERGMHIF